MSILRSSVNRIFFIYFTSLLYNFCGSMAANEFVLGVISTNASGYVHHYGECDAKGASFGVQFSGDDTVTGCAIAAWPRDACDPVVMPQNLTYECLGGLFVVAERGNCSFAQKAIRAQNAKFQGLIVINYGDRNYPEQMGGDSESKITIPSFMVGYDCGVALIERFSYENGFAFYVRGYFSYQDLLRYLVPFVAVVGVCFLVMFSAMVVKLIRDRRRRNRRRLSKKHLKQIPIKKFSAGDDPETCPICLDDFEIGDRLRVLPCGHTYHAHCIDPWLLKNRRVCPICKRKVLPKQAGSSHSDSEPEEATAGAVVAGPSGSISTPERTPLLIHEERNVTVGNSTFYGVYDTSDDSAATAQTPTDSDSIGIGRAIVLSAPSTPDRVSASDDPTVDIDSRQSLLPRSSIHSSVDECTQPGFVTASSSFREGYANPNFVVDAQEFDADGERGAATPTAGEKNPSA